MPANAPIPGRFEEDPRVHFDKTAGKWQYEDDDGEYEWTGQAWVPLTPANAVIAREERRNKKRKKDEKDYTSNTAAVAGAGAAVAGAGAAVTKPATAAKKTAVWVTNLPPNTTVPLLAGVFSKAGVLLIDDEGQPRIKLYHDDEGKFKGEALVMYFKEGSVDLAITLLDDTELELGAGYGNIRVRVAEYEKGQGEKKEEGEKKKLSSKITWHSDDEEDPAAPLGGAPLANRFNRVVVLKGMFLPEDLERDPGLLLELKEEVREEAESLGQVTSVVLYDIYAGLYTGKERFKKSGGIKEFGDDEEGEEKERLDNFAQWLVDGEE
ncbi:hypothetical protein CI109_105557 [Kwoniella shandongensis]|uniref:RRM domain-containing protein n=1 Tax=Kwoniella shandongensis TaxID=1734106 RepID=A0AAJ8LM34_9TREE